MNLLRESLLTLGICLVGHTGFGQVKPDTSAQKTDTLRFSLVQAQQYALENNASILNANLDIEEAKKKVWETTAIGLPQVSAKGSFQYTPTVSVLSQEFSQFDQLPYWMYKVDESLHSLDPTNQAFGHMPVQSTPSATNPNDLKWNLTGDLTVSQLLFSGSYIVGLQSAKVYKSLSQLSQIKSKQDVMESVVNSYINVLVARENKVLIDSTYHNLVKTLSDMKSMGKNGFVEETDVDQMQINVSNVKTSLDMIIRQQDIAEKLLKLQLGVDLNQPMVLTDQLKPVMDSLSVDKLLLTDFVLQDNVSYQMLDAQVKSDKLILKLRKSEFLPDLSAFYQHEKVFNPNAFAINPPDLIGVTLNIPIFSSGARLSRVSQARLELLKSENTLRQSSEALKVDFYSGRTALLNALDKYHSESANMVLAKKIYDRALIKYSNGMISSTDLTQIQNQYLTAQSNYYGAIQSLVAARNMVEKLVTKSDFKG